MKRLFEILFSLALTVSTSASSFGGSMMLLEVGARLARRCPARRRFPLLAR